MSTVQSGPEGPQAERKLPLYDADGNIDWKRMMDEMPPRDPALGPWFQNHEEKAAAEQREIDLFAEYRRIKELEVERERLKLAGDVAPAAAPSSIRLEIAMARDTATVSLRYLYDPFLPSGCVVEGTSESAVTKLGMSSACGMA